MQRYSIYVAVLNEVFEMSDSLGAKGERSLLIASMEVSSKCPVDYKTNYQLAS